MMNKTFGFSVMCLYNSKPRSVSRH